MVERRAASATTVAAGPVSALVIERPAFLELMDRFGAIRLGILMALSDRIRSDDRDTMI